MEDKLFEQGNAAYSRGNYVEAISHYQELIESRGYSAAVLYNLANSYAMSGQTGKAVLNYERALRLSPSHSDISGNLELVKKERGLFPKETSGVEKFFALLRLDQWTALFVISLFLLTCFLFSTLKFSFSKQLKTSVISSSFLLICLTATGIFFRYPFFNPSVVIAPEAKLFISPFESSASIGALQEGRLVYPIKRHGDFSYVVDETDRKGWVPSREIESVCKEGRSTPHKP